MDSASSIRVLPNISIKKKQTLLSGEVNFNSGIALLTHYTSSAKECSGIQINNVIYTGSKLHENSLSSVD